jgi:hypothetical protein
VFNELHGMMSSNPTSASQSNHSCSNRLSAVSSAHRNCHSISNNSTTQLTSPPSAVHTSAQDLSSTAITSTQISQQCQSKSRLLINHKSNDKNFTKNEPSEIILHQSKQIAARANRTLNLSLSNPSMNDNSQMEGMARANHDTENMITIVTVNNNLSHERGNSIA